MERIFPTNYIASTRNYVFSSSPSIVMNWGELYGTDSYDHSILVEDFSVEEIRSH